MQSSEFSFNGIHSYDMGFMNIRMGSSLANRELVGERKINISNYGSKSDYFVQSIDKDPIEFKLLISPIDDRKWTPELYRKLVSWLVLDEYKECYSGDDPYKIYYAICSDYVTWEGVNDYGAIPFSFVTNANHAWTIKKRYSFDIDTEKEISIDNLSVFKETRYYPKMVIKKKNSNGDIVIENKSNAGYKFELKNISPSETIVVDNDYRLIYSQDSPRNIYGESFNKKWLYFVDGINKIKVIGDCEIIMDCQYPTA